jgi:hypothetical protein
MTRLPVILLLTLLLPQLASAKRIAPVNVAPVIYEGIRYVAPNDDGHRGHIEGWNVGTNKKLWELTAGDDFEWMDSWQIYSKTHVVHASGEASVPRLRGDALLVEKSEAASALIYWNGKRYVWSPQGD